MKIYIFADMEGISGIAGSMYVRSNESHYDLGRKFLTADINACAAACFEAGADEVVVRDGHALRQAFLRDRRFLRGDPAGISFDGGSPRSSARTHLFFKTHSAPLDERKTGR